MLSFPAKQLNEESPHKPAVYLVVLLPIQVIGGLAIVFGLISIYARSKGIAVSAIPQLNGFLIALPAYFLWCPISLMLGNAVLFLVPPLRKIAERYTSRAGGPSFWDAQRALAKFVFYVAVATVPLIALGFCL